MLEFDEKSGKVKISPYIAKIKDFEPLVSHPKSINAFTAMYHLVNPLSSYAQYSEDERRDKVIDDVFDGDSSLIESSIFTNALNKYEELSQTALTRSLDSAQSLIHRIRLFFDTVDFDERTRSGSAVFKPKEVLATMQELEKAADSIDSLEKKVMKQEQLSEDRIRKGVVINPFND